MGGPTPNYQVDLSKNGALQMLNDACKKCVFANMSYLFTILINYVVIVANLKRTYSYYLIWSVVTFLFLSNTFLCETVKSFLSCIFYQSYFHISTYHLHHAFNIISECNHAVHEWIQGQISTSNIASFSQKSSKCVTKNILRILKHPNFNRRVHQNACPLINFAVDHSKTTCTP